MIDAYNFATCEILACSASLYLNWTICCFFGGVASLHDENDMFDQLNQLCYCKFVTIDQTYNFATGV